MWVFEVLPNPVLTGVLTMVNRMWVKLANPARAPFCVVLFCVVCVFCLLVVLVRLSVPVQVIDWKESSPK